jgi:hypothetical protein
LKPALKICCVVIPVYKAVPDTIELSSFKQCLKVLGTHPVILAAPQTLDTGLYNEVSNGAISVERFDDAYFNDLAGYNKLMLSATFYECFTAFRYILIYQLDAWIFRDELEEWCSKNYDYIGAPWIEHEWAQFAAGHLTFVRTVLYKLGYRKFDIVGNGGLSLRKVRSCIFNLNVFKRAAASFEGNEDAFFSFFINSYNPFFRIPSSTIALNFSFDIHPEVSFRLNGNHLPMGCHAWNKNQDFWNEYIIHEPIKK